MCLAIPGKLVDISADPNGVRMGKANFGGIVKQVCLEYTPEVELGDYVLVHVGFALSKVDEAEAARTRTQSGLTKGRCRRALQMERRRKFCRSKFLHVTALTSHEISRRIS